MPESVTDRPTKAHEYVFLLTKKPRYFFDQEAVREPHTGPPPEHYGVRTTPKDRGVLDERVRVGEIVVGSARVYNAAGRNVRSVWEIATQPYPEAHFATFPEELARRCILAGCPTEVCRRCGKPRERIVEETAEYTAWKNGRREVGYTMSREGDRGRSRTNGYNPEKNTTLGWSDCGHGDYRPGVVLDPFLGSGTTALVARRHGRHCVGVELSPEYARLAAKRLQQLSLLAEGAS